MIWISLPGRGCDAGRPDRLPQSGVLEQASKYDCMKWKLSSDRVLDNVCSRAGCQVWWQDRLEAYVRSGWLKASILWDINSLRRVKIFILLRTLHSSLTSSGRGGCLTLPKECPWVLRDALPVSKVLRFSRRACSPRLIRGPQS